MDLDKQEIKIIAQALIAKSGESFYGAAFLDCEGMLDEEEVQAIINEIQRICTSTLVRLNKKHDLDLGCTNSTADLIESVLYKPN